MLSRQGMTLFEIIIVLIIIGICAAFVTPNFLVPSEQAKALTAKNNLMAIYAAQQNYNNNNGGNNNYCINSGARATCADSLADINTSLSLNIQDDGSYTYFCSVSGSAYTCTAQRSSNNNTLVISLNSANNGAANIVCNLPATWCP